MHAGDLARRYFQKFSFDDFFRDYRLDGFGNIVQSKPQTIGHHGDGFRQAVMFDDAGGVMPAPIFFCSGRRRLEASTMRTALSQSMRCATALSVSASLSITKPGFTPVPTSATPSCIAAASSFWESSRCLRKG